MNRWPSKDPQEVLDYEVDWSERIGTDDLIATSSFTVPTGITKVTSSFSDNTTIVWISGGVTGTSYQVTNTVTTTGGRTFEETITLPVKDR